MREAFLNQLKNIIELIYLLFVQSYATKFLIFDGFITL